MPVLTVLLAALVTRLRGGDPERGDVPGWVLVTVMTAGIVVALGGVAVPALTGMFEQAIAAVALP